MAGSGWKYTPSATNLRFYFAMAANIASRSADLQVSTCRPQGRLDILLAAGFSVVYPELFPGARNRAWQGR
jgi:hypothetical protein